MAEGGGVGVVDVRDAVLGAVHEGDEGGQSAQDLGYAEVLDGGDVGQGLRLLFVLTAGHTAGLTAGHTVGLTTSLVARLIAGCGHRALPRCAGEIPWSVLRAAARRCVPGSLALQRVKFTDFLASMLVAKGHSVHV